jgi:hypothetical protein
LAVIWVFVLKLKTFYALGYTSDPFVDVQLARSWLEGRGLLQDNCFGNVLVIHTYFLLLPLGLIAKPFGAPGLLFVLAASVGTAYFWATCILRLLGVDGRVAVIVAGVVLTAPLSVAFYQDPGFGFHVEILAPALCLILFYFLLQQRMIPSIVTALAVISVKEDAPIAAAMVAMVAGVETWISSAGKRSRCRFNWPVAITLLFSFPRSLFYSRFPGYSRRQRTLVTRLTALVSWRREAYPVPEHFSFLWPPTLFIGLVAALSVNGYGS